MKKVLLDSNFIITCMKQKIDFFEDLTFRGFKIMIPEQIIRELKGLKIPEAALALKLLEKSKFEKIDIGKGHVDKRIKKFADENSKVLIATLDSELKKKLKNQKVVIRGKKKLEII